MYQYKAFLEEMYPGKSCYIDPKNRGWMSYWVRGKECYIEDIYICPEYRGSYAAEEISKEIEKIAKASGCEYMTGTVVPTSLNPERSIKMLFHAGYKISSAHDNLIIFIKPLEK
jgi:predicted GNAT superfamily acetyltransferase